MPAEERAIATACLGLVTTFPPFPECNSPFLNSVYTLDIFFSFVVFFMDNLIEQWADLPNYESHYQISNLGNFCRKIKTGRVFRKLNTATHYLSVSLKDIDGKGQKTIYIHTMVAKLFISERPDGMVIRHLDGNRFNNKVTNLAYGYPEQNYEDSKKHGTFKGSKNGRAILNENSAKAITYLLTQGISVQMLADAFCVSTQTIYKIKYGQSWNH